MKVFGPYTSSKDKRRRVIIVENGKKRTITYAKHLLEQKLGRKLSRDETVDHIDRDPYNDSVDNLQILSLAEHAKLDAVRVKLVTIVCVGCGAASQKRPNHLNHNAKQGRAGPFCGRSCSGKYNRAVQLDRTAQLPAQKPVPKEDREYYQLDK